MVSKFLQRRLAKQLSDPSGLLGAVVAKKLNQRNGKAIAEAVGTLNLAGGESVADIGFGGGLGLELLLNAVGTGGDVHGVEPSASMVARARKEFRSAVLDGHLTVNQATMDSLPFADGELDGWISLNTIYFIPELDGSFSELARVTASSGRGVLGVADPDWLGRQPFAEHGFTVRSIEEVDAALRAAGLRVAVRTVEDPDSGGKYNLLVCTHAD